MISLECRSLYEVLSLYAADYIWLGSIMRHLALKFHSMPPLQLIDTADREEVQESFTQMVVRCKKLAGC